MICFLLGMLLFAPAFGQATPEFRMTGDDPDLKNISVFTAVQQQLGLKLESQKAMIEVLVVDHVEKPSAN